MNGGVGISVLASDKGPAQMCDSRWSLAGEPFIIGMAKSGQRVRPHDPVNGETAARQTI